MQVSIDSEKCQGHAMCILACPQAFVLSDEDGHAYTTITDIPVDLSEAVLQAQRSCPEQAIIISN